MNNKKPDMLVIIPSRNRPKSVAEITKCLIEQSIDIDICFGLDDDDTSEYEYVPGVIYERNPRVLMNGTNNILATKYANDYKFICFLGDDVRPRTFGWDKILSYPLLNNPGISYANDLIQKEFLPTHIVMSSEIIKALGFMAPPVLKHLYMDYFWLDLGNAINSIHYFEDVILEHMHPLLEKAPPDQVYYDSWSLNEQDMAAYKNYKDLELSKDVEKVIKFCENFKDSIVVSIASYRDTDLVNTVSDCYNKAKNKDKLFFSIVCQDEYDAIPDLNFIPETNIRYIKKHWSEAKGTCWARSIANSSLKSKYFLQVDSHSRFKDNWDEIIINSYKKAQEFWGKDMIFTNYPDAFGRNLEDNSLYFYEDHQKSLWKNVPIIDEESNSIRATWIESPPSDFGEEVFWFCGGGSFCEYSVIDKVPYDPEMYIDVEEFSMAIRLYTRGIKLVSPPVKYMYSNYHRRGAGRSLHWDDDPNWHIQREIAYSKFFDIIDGKDLGIYGIGSLDLYNEYQKNIGIDLKSINHFYRYNKRNSDNDKNSSDSNN
jgi:hypothetical protein